MSNEKLELWQKRLAESDTYWGGEVAKMDHREALYNGDHTVKPLVPGDVGKNGEQKKTSHVRNIIFENIESQVSSAIPMPKVTPRRKKDERLAEIIEHRLRNEINRIPSEQLNDMAERTVLIQGGVGFLVEWDNAKRTGDGVGEVELSVIHPKQFAPQPGVYTSVADMDWFIIKKPTTKEAVKRRYGVDVFAETESEPEIRGTSAEHADDALTQYIGYEWAEGGKINRYSWVNEIELEDLENYQSRREPVCAKCGTVKPLPQAFGETEAQDDGRCAFCGSHKWTSRVMDQEEIMVPIRTAMGNEIPGAVERLIETGLTVMVATKVPYYQPDMYPIVIQKSVSVFGQLLGNSDVDVIEDQQNTTNRLEQKIIDRLMKAGSRITLPDRANLRVDPVDGERWYLDKPADRNMIGLFDFKGNLEFEMLYLSQVYEEARQILGVTNSFQGRPDSTATSGLAKQYAAAQAAGRLESKRIMKNAAYAAIYELMFKSWLAYADEPRAVSYKDQNGQTQYEEFNRYDFLERLPDGSWVWNDQFLFGCDTSTPLASNREGLWQETRQNLQNGAFGDPTQTDTLILFWGKMEELHYPGAAMTRKYLEDRRRQEQTAMAAQQLAAAGGAAGMPQNTNIPPAAMAAGPLA